MVRKKPIDPEIPPTTREDWLGAIKGDRLRARKTIVPNPTTFHIFRASTVPSMFGVTDADDSGKLPPCPDGGEWIYFKRFEESGQQRVGLSEAEAKADIRKQGYHIARTDVLVEAAAAAR